MNRKPTAPKETEIKIFAPPEIPALVKLWGEAVLENVTYIHIVTKTIKNKVH